MKIYIASFILSASISAIAAPLSCYEEPRTNAYQCVDKAQVFEKKGIRSTAMYTGGPNGVTKTSFTLHVNCETNVTHLKDRQGVSFAGGNGSETEAVRTLRQMVCEAKPKK